MEHVARAESISAVTFHVADMDRACRFYEDLGFELVHGGADTPFSSYGVGDGFVNLQLVEEAATTGWGRVIFHVTDVDAMHARVLDAGYVPDFEPRDASWGERYFHLKDPDGHELSFARPL